MKFLLLLLVPVLSFAATSKKACSPIDLRNQFLETNRNQQDVAWCYAFTAADNLAHTYELRDQVSAADIAIRYNETKVGKISRWFSVNVINRRSPDHTRTTHQTGFNVVAFKKVLQGGWCPESVLPSEAWKKITFTETGTIETMMPLKEAMMEIKDLHDKRKTLTIENLPYYFSFKNIGPEEFIGLLQVKNIDHFYFGLRKLACKDDREPFSEIPKVKMTFKNPNIFKKINDNLNKSQLVSLDYDSRILEDASQRGANLSELHTSNIVARRWNTAAQTCEFLIRDSYGPTCDGRYDQSYECEDGNVWLSEQQIFKNMTSIVTLKKD